MFVFEKGNFSLVENGNPIPVDEVKKVDNSTDPLSIVLVLDRSGSMEYAGATGALDTAAINFVNQLGTKDEAEIINFDHNVVVAQGFTNNHGQLTNAITNYAALGGATALYDAIGQAATDLSSRRGRKFILAMTDGWNNASTAYPELTEISSYVNSKGLSVFIVGLGDVDKSSLQKLAVDSGGRYFEADNASELNTLYQQALVQFNNEIVIKFRSLTQGSRNLKIYINYGRFGQSFEKVYSD